MLRTSGGRGPDVKFGVFIHHCTRGAGQDRGRQGSATRHRRPLADTQAPLSVDADATLGVDGYAETKRDVNGGKGIPYATSKTDLQRVGAVGINRIERVVICVCIYSLSDISAPITTGGSASF